MKASFIPLKAIVVGQSCCGKFCSQNVRLNPEFQETMGIIFCRGQVHVQQLVVKGFVMFKDYMSGHAAKVGLKQTSARREN